MGGGLTEVTLPLAEMKCTTQEIGGNLLSFLSNYLPETKKYSLNVFPIDS
jgi:hypothetical protein